MERGSAQSDRDQLAPVDLITRTATTISLPTLQWSHYDIMPDTIYAKNTGFTVSIQASFSGEVPYLSSGPLAGNYNFSQVHFHWGENDKTGSGHSVDGARYPLEMHVVHVKKEFDNLKEAGKEKDGIAIAVHLFSLTEERNIHLDQLTAVLQFIQKPNCCAKLYPSSLSEIVQPFSKDYFLYWGAVTGPSQQNYPITWLVSRNKLPVSSKQLQQFRQLCDRRGQLILLNSNNPHPLGDRSLFLVSPSEKPSSTMIDSCQRPTRSIMTLESEKSIEIHNAEFKSLVALDDAEVGSCMICPHPNHAGYDTTKKAKKPLSIRKGDTSVEESCVNLGTLEVSQVTENIELKVKNVEHEYITDCGHSCSSKFIPSQDIDSVISGNKEEIHVKHKPLTIRKSGPSTEEGCMFLTKPSSVHVGQSVSSSTVGGYLNTKQEFLNVSDSPQRNNSSEVVVLKTDLLSSDNHKLGEEIENLVIKSTFKNAATQVSKDVYNVVEKESPHNVISQAKYPASAVLTEHSCKEGMVAQLKSRENELHPGEVLNDGIQTEYLLVKQAEPKKSFYKVIGELLLTPESKRTFVKHEINTNKTCLAEINDESKNKLLNKGSPEKYNVYDKVVISIPPSEQGVNNNQVIQYGNQVQTENIKENKSKMKPDENSRYRINLRLQKPESSTQQNIEGKKQGPPLYYVTKITPVKGSQTVNQELSTEKKLYYAKPIRVEKEIITGKSCQLQKNTSSNNYHTSNIIQQQIDDIKKHHTCSQSTENHLEEEEVNLSVPKKQLVDNENNITNTLEINIPSDHLLKRKQVKVVAPHEKASPSETMNSPQKKSLAQNFTDSTLSQLKCPKIKTEILQDPQDSTKSVGILKTEITHQVTETRRKLYFPDNETASNKQIELKKNDHPNKTSNTDRVKYAQGEVKNQRRSLKSNEFLGNINTVSPSRSAEIIVEKFEENLVYSSQKSKKKIIFQQAKPTYKIPIQPSVVTNRSSSQHLIRLKKVEIPDPYYLTRVPKQPLTEYEAFPFGQDQQNEPLETDKKSEGRTNVTFTSTKNVPPTALLPADSKNIKEEKYSSNKATETSASICDQILKPEEDNININVNYKIKHQNHKCSPNINNNKNDENMQQITVDIYQSGIPLVGQKTENNGKINEIKSTRIIIGSHHPRAVGDEETKSFNKIRNNEGNNKVNSSEMIIQSDQQEIYSTSFHNQPDDMKDCTSSVDDTRSIMTNLDDQTISTEPTDIPTDEVYESNRTYIDAATSNPTTSLTFNSPYSHHQQTQTLNYDHFEEEPTKDPGFDSIDKQGSSQSKKSKTEITSIKVQDNEKENSSPSINLNIGSTTLSTTKADGEIDNDAIVYIHHPKPSTRSSSKQFSVDETKHVPTPDLNADIEKKIEIIQKTESEKIISNSKKPSTLKKSISEGTNQPLTKSYTADEELISTHNYESDKEEITNPTQCNVTFKNETQVELPSGEKAHMKSIAEVKLKPVTKSSKTNKSSKSHVKPSGRVTTGQGTITTEDKGCSTTGLKEGSISVDTSSEEDEPTINESNVINYSPIKIETENTLFKNCPSLQFIDHWNGINGDALLENNGKTLRATILSDTELPYLRGGPLKSDYIFAELHFHWGRKDCCGAEHVIDDQRRSMEAHFTYVKKEYGSVKDALSYADGLAVVAIQMNVGGPPHPSFGKLIKDIELIREADTGVYVPAESLFSWIKQTVKKSKGYFTYKGTMTTEHPPVESVTWLIFQQPVILCCQQSLEFRKLMSPDGELLLKNHKAPRPTNKRPICYVPL